VNQAGQSNSLTLPQPVPGEASEIDMDVEWAHAMAPGANIVLVEANPTYNPQTKGYYVTTTDMRLAVQTAVQQFGASVVSISAYYNGDQGILSYPGVTFVASSGDLSSQFQYPVGGSAALIVGGTQLTANSLYGTESVWNDNFGSSNGGTFADVPLPSWQASAADR
jgi:subtilase family serine protease